MEPVNMREMQPDLMQQNMMQENTPLMETREYQTRMAVLGNERAMREMNYDPGQQRQLEEEQARDINAPYTREEQQEISNAGRKHKKEAKETIRQRRELIHQRNMRRLSRPQGFEQNILIRYEDKIRDAAERETGPRAVLAGKRDVMLQNMKNMERMILAMAGWQNAPEQVKNAISQLEGAKEMMGYVIDFSFKPFETADKSFFEVSLTMISSMFGNVARSIREASETIRGIAGEDADKQAVAASLSESKDAFLQNRIRLSDESYKAFDRKEHTDWNQIMQRAGVEQTMKYTRRVEHTGGALSDVLKIQEGDRLRYFKGEEKIQSDAEIMSGALKKEKNQELKDKLSQIPIEGLKEITKLIAEDEDGNENKIFMQVGSKYGLKTTREIFGLQRVYREFKRQNSTKEVGARIGLEVGANLSNRNLATERMAELLGMKNLIVHNEKQKLESDEGVKQGFIMEEGKGKSSRDLVHDMSKGKIVAHNFSGQAQRKLCNLQIMDNICGQKDRHGGNIMHQYRMDEKTKSMTVTDVIGIDNDMAFGKMFNLTNTRNQTMGILKSHSKDFRMHVMDQEMYERINLLTEDMIRDNMEGLIEPEYMDSLTRRFAVIKAAVNKAREEAEKRGEKFLYQENEWGSETEEKLSMIEDDKQELMEDITSGKMIAPPTNYMARLNVRLSYVEERNRNRAMREERRGAIS